MAMVITRFVAILDEGVFGSVKSNKPRNADWFQGDYSTYVPCPSASSRSGQHSPRSQAIYQTCAESFHVADAAISNE